MAETTPPPAPEEEQNVVVNPRSKQNLTPDEINEVISALLVDCLWSDDKLPFLWCGILCKVGFCFGVSTRQLQCMWKRAKTNFEDPNIKAFEPLHRRKKTVTNCVCTIQTTYMLPSRQFLSHRKDHFTKWLLH
jgi:hypothetical protein